MNHSDETRCPSRRQFLVSSLSLSGFALTLGSVSLSSGCGDDKGQMTPVENATDPAKTSSGMDSMNFYKGQHLDKKGQAKK
jgi:hypothetical protein